MIEFLYHVLGICGEHNHPHLINLSLVVVGTCITFKIINSYGILASKSKG